MPLADPKHEAFALQIAQGRSKREAAIAAGFSEKSASTMGGRLSKKVEISRRIVELQSKVETATIAKVAITIDRVVAEYGKLAFLDIRQAFDSEGRLLPIREIDDDTAAAIAGIEVEDRTSGSGEAISAIRLHKIKLNDKKGALDSLAKYLGMFKERVELTGKDGAPLQIERIERVIVDPKNTDP